MANNNINFNTAIENGKINVYLKYRADKIARNGAVTALTTAFADLDKMAPGVFSIDKVKGGDVKLNVNPDAENLPEILTQTGEARKVCADAVNYRNACVKAMTESKKTAFDLIPNVDEAFLDLSESGDESGMETVWRGFLENLGMDVTDKAVTKFMNRVIPTLNPGKYSDKGMNTKFTSVKGMNGKEQIWRALHNYLLNGLPTRCKDEKGDFVYILGKNGKKTTRIETIITGGGFVIHNAEDGSLVYANKAALERAKAETDTETAA